MTIVSELGPKWLPGKPALVYATTLCTTTVAVLWHCEMPVLMCTAVSSWHDAYAAYDSPSNTIRLLAKAAAMHAGGHTTHGVMHAAGLMKSVYHQEVYMCMTMYFQMHSCNFMRDCGESACFQSGLQSHHLSGPSRVSQTPQTPNLPVL